MPKSYNSLCHYLWRLLCLGVSLVAVFAASYSAASNPIIIDIDNPKFRKLVVATPRFEVVPANDKALQELSAKGSAEFERLLTFSGYFQVIKEAAYRDILKNPPTNIKTSLPGFEGIDLLKWKGIGVEALNLGKLVRLSSGKIRLELRSADIHKGERLIGKAYTISSLGELETRLKRYIDYMLVRYTGKPGIFSSQIVFIGRRSKASEKQVFISDIDGKNLQQLTFAKAAHLSPSWSPDGSKVLFTSYQGGKPDIYMLDLKSKKMSSVASYEGLSSGGVFSPHGKIIAFSGSIKGGNTEIYYKTPEQKTRTSLVRGQGIDVDPAFSPDGKWLAFVSGRFGNPHIFRAPLTWNAGQTQVQVAGDRRLTYAGWYNATPAWSPDSEKLAFAGFDRQINRFDLFLMNHDGTNLERLTIRTGDNESPSWSPNGQLIMFHSNRTGTTDVKGRSQIYIMNRDGSNQRLIPTGLYDAQTPKWGPNLLSDY